MKIKIIGSNSSNGMKLHKKVTRASKVCRDNVVIELVDDTDSIRDYKIKNIPGLIINERKVSEGYVPSVREIESLLIKA